MRHNSMQNEPQPPVLGFDPVTGEPQTAPPPLPAVAEAPPQKKLLAPVWHTVLMIVILVGNSAFTAYVASKLARGTHSISGTDRYVSYISSIFLELFLLVILWLGLRLHQTRIRELIGGKWSSPEDFLIDFAIAIGFAVASYLILAALSFAMGMARPNQIEESKKLASMLAPHSWGALGVFVLLSATAGFVEELLFRGYLQRQVGVLTGKIYIGVVVSALIFGGGHGYEGVRRMVLIFIFGLMFSALTLWRRNLRSAMMGHALFDAAQGILLFIAARTGLVPMR